MITEVRYRTPGKPGSCNIQNGGGVIVAHERCHCPDHDIGICKGYCDDDSNCKGYVKLRIGCQTATTSNCSYGCYKYNAGETGALLFDNEYSSDNYGGCYIKLAGIVYKQNVIILSFPN